MISKTFPQKKQRTGIPLTQTIVIACVTSLISIVASIDIGQAPHVSPGSTERISDKILQNASDRGTLQASRPHEELSGGRGSDPVESYPAVTNAPEAPREVTAGTDLQAYKPDDERASGLERLQNVYDPYLWGLSPPGELGTKCDADMKTYLSALNNSTVWAAKSTYKHSFDCFTAPKILGAKEMCIFIQGVSKIALRL
jgi:hypothetical protein